MSNDTEIIRADRYTIIIKGERVRATLDQELRLRSMSPEQRGRFLTIMGRSA